MRRIKLVISDFHLGTGARLEDGSQNPEEDFFEEGRLIEFLDYHSTGDFSDDEVELVINGDFFNMIQGRVDYIIPTEITEDIAIRQLSDILDGHPRLVAALNQFARRPLKSLTFIVGNHDFGLVFPGVQALLRERLNCPLKLVEDIYAFDEVHVEHGDRYEPVHAFDRRDNILERPGQPPILNLPWGTFFHIHYVQHIKRRRPYIDKVTPFRNYLIWAALNDFPFFLFAITKLIVFVFATAIYGAVGPRRFGVSSLFTLLRQNQTDHELRAARRMLLSQPIHTVIFGHTHHPLYRQFAPGKEYFNTGCWNPVTNMDIEGLGYQSIFTYAHLEWRDSRWRTRLLRFKGRPSIVESFWG